MFFYVDGPTSSKTQTQTIDPKEQRRQRDRERYAQMDSLKKEELLKRKRESRQRQKSSTCNKENDNPTEGSEWLSRNDNYQRQSIHMPSQAKEIIPTGMIATHSLLR
jgi:hypothetical protein